MVPVHEHKFVRYVMYAGRHGASKWFNDGRVEPTQDAGVLQHRRGPYYVGYECRCGEQGYAVPA
jgi:hypothetical protein